MSIVSKVKVSVSEYHVLDEFALADEDGVFLYETMFQLVGAIAQECDAIINPHSIDIVVPKLSAPSAAAQSQSQIEGLGRDRPYRKVRTDEQLMLYLRKWTERSQVNMRKAIRRRYALKEILRVLQAGSKPSTAVEDLVDEPIKSLEDKDAERLAAMQSLRELAYNVENHQAILEHSDLIKVVIDMYMRDSEFDGEHSIAASATLWSLSCNPETRKVLRSMECLEAILRMLERTGMLSKPFAPVSHEFSLVTLLGLLSDCESDRLKQLLTVEYIGFDVIQYFATLSNSCTSGDVFRHTLSILGVLLTGQDQSMSYFMNEYQGNASKIMDSLILNLNNQNQRYLDSGNRFLLSTLVAQFALFSKQSRHMLIERNTERLCTLLLRLIRGVLFEASNHSAQVADSKEHPKGSAAENDSEEGKAEDLTIFKTFDLTFEFVTLLVRESQPYSTVDLDAVLSRTDVTKRKGENLFDGNEWGMSRDRAHELTLLNAAAALYEITLAVVETDGELPSVLLCTLLTLVLVSRQEMDPRPAVEQCALAALSLLAQAKTQKYALALLASCLQQAEGSKKHPVVYATLLGDICLGTGDVTLAALERASISLHRSSSRINKAYGLALLSGLLRSCLFAGLDASLFLKSLDLNYLLHTAGSLPVIASGSAEGVESQQAGEGTGIQARHILRCFSAACLMLHSCLEVSPKNDGTGTKPKWTAESLKKLLGVLEGEMNLSAKKSRRKNSLLNRESNKEVEDLAVDVEVDVEEDEELEQAPPPVGITLTFLKLCVWGLAKHKATRDLMKPIPFVKECCMALNRSIEYLDIYCSVANQGISNVNKLSQIKSKRIMEAMQKSNAFTENRAVLEASQEHLESMIATINALFALCADKGIAAQLAKVSIRRANGSHIDAFTLFEIALHCVNRKNAIWTHNANTRDTIAARLLSFLHMLAANDTFYFHFTVPSLLELLSRTAYNEIFSAKVRTSVAELFLFLDTYCPDESVLATGKVPKSGTEVSQRKTNRVEAICNLLGETYVPELVINFLKSDIEAVNKSGADMLFRVRETELGKELIRNEGGCKLLLNLAKHSDSFDLVESTLKGLLHMSKDAIGQVHLCSIGLYDVLYLCWTVTHDIHRYYCALLMENLSKNPKNKTALYKAELRARKMLGWKDMTAPNINRRRQSTVSSSTTNNRQTLEDSRSGSGVTIVEMDNEGKQMEAPKEKFLKWFDDVFMSNDSDLGEQQRQVQKRLINIRRSTLLQGAPLEVLDENKSVESVQEAAIPKFIVDKVSWAAKRETEEAFDSCDPLQSPLWPFRHLIKDQPHALTNTTSSDLISPCVSYDLAQPYSHSRHTPFSEKQYRQANACLQMRLRQPARTLWSNTRLTYQGNERWNAKIDVAVKRPTKPSGKKPRRPPNPHRVINPSNCEEDDIEVIVTGHQPKRKYTFRSKYSTGGFGSPSNLTRPLDGAQLDQMFLFRHTPGSQIYEGLPSHSLPNGQTVYVYYNGKAVQGSNAKPKKLYVPVPPSEIQHLELPVADGLPGIPAINTREGWVQMLLGSIYLSRFVSVPPVAETHSLEAHGNRQYNTNVSWTRRGSIDDEKLPLDIVDREANVGDSDDSDDESEAEWCLENSVFSSRARADDEKSYQDGEEHTLAVRAFETDWQLCDQKRTFRKLLAKSPTTVTELKQVIRERYHFLCGIFRFYSAQDPAANIFTMQMTEFSQFLEDTRIKETSKNSLMNEGNCGTLFIQVAFNSIDMLNETQIGFAEECRILSLSKNHSLMRYQFLEVVIRLAHAKYFVSGIAPSFLVAVKFLLDQNILKHLKHEVGVQPDRFRTDRLYCTRMDDVFHSHLLFLKSLFKMYAGCGANSHRWGGARRLRMTTMEWTNLLTDAGIISAIFTQREASVVFRTSSEEVVDDIKSWRAAVTLNFTSFLEAIARVAETAFIPTREQLENVGADDIIQFYHIMQATGLWTTIADTEEKNSDPLVDLAVWGITKAKTMEERVARANLEYDERPLEWKLEQLVILLKHVKARADAKKYRKVPRMSSRLVGPKKDKDKLKDKEKEKEKEKEPRSDNIRADHELSLEITKSVKDKLSLQNFETHVASSLHDMWRKSRGQQENGKYVPRVKLIKGITYDIANLHFKDLPGHFAMENLLAAHVACESIRSAHRAYQEDPSSVLLDEKDAANVVGGSIHPLHKYLRSSKFLSWAGEQQHVQWLKRNGMKEWVEDHQRVSYAELTEADRKKCEQIAVIAAEFWIANDTDK